MRSRRRDTPRRGRRAGRVGWAYLATLAGFDLPAAAASLSVVVYRVAQAVLPALSARCASSTWFAVRGHRRVRRRHR